MLTRRSLLLGLTALLPFPLAAKRRKHHKGKHKGGPHLVASNLAYNEIWGQPSVRVVDHTPAYLEQAVRHATQVWSGLGASPNLTYVRGSGGCTGPVSGEIAVCAAPYVENGRTGQTETWVNSNNTRQMLAARITFYERPGLEGDEPYARFIMAHEGGHALGLGHSTAPDSVMYTQITYVQEPNAGDKATLTARYSQSPPAGPGKKKHNKKHKKRH